MKIQKFQDRHIGINPEEEKLMLSKIGVKSLDELIDQTIPANIRLQGGLNLPEALSEHEYAEEMALMASKNRICASYIGMGWYDTICPAPIFRNVFENPVWYTSYTPYQAEVSQGRLEALLNYQTVITELTGMEIANASLLDEATAAAEAMIMMHNSRSRAKAKGNANVFVVDNHVWPQTKAVLETRSAPLGIELKYVDMGEIVLDDSVFGLLVQYPDSDGEIRDYESLTRIAHDNDCTVAVAADLMSLVLLTPPGEWGADIVLGTSQRFGIPMGYGGPHAAYFATREAFKRSMPGRIIGVSKDANGHRALRMALQTREQHIKREKATSNICTAQALLATMASFYAVYHGSEGLTVIAERIHGIARLLDAEISKLGYTQLNKHYFDTIRFSLPEGIRRSDIERLSLELEMNFRYFDNGEVGLSIDETTNLEDVNWILEVFAKASYKEIPHLGQLPELHYEGNLKRNSVFLKQEVFNKYRSETELVRYIKCSNDATSRSPTQ